MSYDKLHYVFMSNKKLKIMRSIIQGIVDGSESKRALRLAKWLRKLTMI